MGSTSDDSPLQVHLDGEMTIRRASELKPLLLPALEHPGGVCLQLREVTEIDATGVQLLLATQVALRALGRPFHLQNCSAPVAEALAVLGLYDTLAPAGGSVH